MISRIKKDKLLHFIAGTYIFMLSAIFVNQLVSLMIVVVIGALKELVYDKALNKGTTEVADFIFTFLGGMFTFLIFIALK